VATVFVPARADAEITEGGKPIARAAGVRLSGRENGSVVLNVAAGEYHFASPLE